MVERGWFGSGSMVDSGIIFPTGVSWRAVSSSTKWVSWRIFTRMGQTALAGRLRHGSTPPRKAGSTRRLPSTAARR